MKITCLTQTVYTSVNLPSSKSESNRVLIIKSLCKELNGEIKNLSDADDTKVLNNILNLPDSGSIFDVGHAGTAMRFLTAYFSSIKGKTIVLTGSERMQNRPIGILVEALNRIGANIKYIDKKGFPPLSINGQKLNGGALRINGSISSQYISALLMIAPTLSKGLVLEVKGKLVSKPYVAMTISLMRYFGAEIIEKENKFEIVPTQYTDQSITIEADWSAASYWYQIAALSSDCKIELRGLFKESRQGDQKIIKLFESLGVLTHWSDSGIILTKKKSLKALNSKVMEFSLEDTPDLAQTIICTCAGLGVEASFKGLSTLKIKETNRLEALRKELKKFNIELTIENDAHAYLIGGQVLQRPNEVIETYQDHRMAMSIAPLTLIIGELNVLNPNVVKKSYPNYWKDLGVCFNIET